MSELSFYDLTYEGPVVQAILDTAQKLRTEGYIFMGAGTPSTVPGTPTERVWYLCGPGTYANFGTSVAVPDGSVMVASYANSTWTKVVIAINGGAAVSGWKVVDSVASLPSSPEDPSLGWIIDNTVYLYVGEGGDTLSGKYQSMGDFQGPQGEDGATGPQGPAGLDGISIGDNWTAFSALNQLDGKTYAEKQAMVPDGNAVEELHDNDYTLLDLLPFKSKKEAANNSGAVGATASLAFVEEANFDLIIQYCNEGDIFRLTCAGGNTYVAYTFLNASNKILATSGGLATLVDKQIIAPANTNKIVIHNNYTLSATFKAFKLLPVVDSVDEVDEYLHYIPQLSSDNKAGTISSETGAYTSLPTTYHVWRLHKFALDPTKRYVADVFLRAYTSAKHTYAGVAYFDANDKFIISEYNAIKVDQDLKKVPLHVPSNAAYCWIAGSDAYEYTYTKGQLYLMSGKDDAFASYDGEYEETITEITLKGNDSTLVTSIDLGLKPNALYRLYATPKTWTVPQPTATTGAFVFAQYVETGTIFTGLYAQHQNDFTEVDGVEVFVDPSTTITRIWFRALSSQYITFRIAEVKNVRSIAATTKTLRTPSRDGIEYHFATVKSPVYDNGNSQGTALEFTDIDSAWGIVWPQSYTQDGKPTQVIAMLHGSVGYVTPTVLGYDTTTWKNWRNAYLSAGFAVMDINGMGVSTASDGKSKYWSSPIAMETIDKAFEFLRQNYNVADKLLLHGSSMGGAAAWSYALTHGNKVAGLALFAPATLSWIMLVNRNISDNYEAASKAWMYADAAAGVADDFQKIVGYDPILNCQRYDSQGVRKPVTQLAGYDVLSQGTDVLVGPDIQYPVRVWHGTSDADCPFQLSQIVTTAYRNGGNNVTLRICPNATHNLCTGSVQYVIDESIDFMEMYGG